jgi:MoaA/NifB/PqqE/SkfB family radical SAM enzyme
MLQPDHSYTDAFCNLPSSHIKVNVIGEVTMCCYQEHSLLGNLLDEPIEDIWNSPLAKDIRRVTYEQKLHPCCESWNACPFVGMKLKAREKSYVHPYLPTSVEIDLPNSHCNIGGTKPSAENPACIMCPRNDPWVQASPDFTVDNTDRIIDAIRCLMPTLRELTILGVAEPFWKGLIFDVMKKLDFNSYKDNVSFWTFTNGSLCNERVMQQYLLSVSQSKLSFSIDAATPETYIAIRRLNFFDTIKRNIAQYAKIKGDNHFINVQNTISTMNAHEMPMMVDYAWDVHADSLTFNPVHNCRSTGLSEILVNKTNLTMFQDYYAKAEERACLLGVKLHLFRTFEQAI